jgi:hypothetical protein
MGDWSRNCCPWQSTKEMGRRFKDNFEPGRLLHSGEGDLHKFVNLLEAAAMQVCWMSSLPRIWERLSKTNMSHDE